MEVLRSRQICEDHLRLFFSDKFCNGAIKLGAEFEPPLFYPQDVLVRRMPDNEGRKREVARIASVLLKIRFVYGMSVAHPDAEQIQQASLHRSGVHLYRPGEGECLGTGRQAAPGSGRSR